MEKMLRINLQDLLCRLTGLVLAVFMATSAQAITRTWDGGGGSTAWTNNANWNPDGAPAASDVLIIDGAVTVDAIGIPGENLGQYSNVTLTNGASLTKSSGAFRMNGSTINVASNCTLAGGWWDMDRATVNFQDGAKTTMSQFELRNANVLSFRLGPSGFTKLTPGQLYGQPGDAFSKLTIKVDMTDYAGGPTNMLLMDFSGNASSTFLNRANFLSGATRIITNAGSYSNSIVYFDAVQVAFVLKVSSIPVTPPMADLMWDGGGGNLLWGTAANWDPDFAPSAGLTVAINSPVTVDYNSTFPACTITLTNSAGLRSNGGAIRMGGATINVASNSLLSGGFWDLGSGTFNFQNGAQATMSDWEQKDVNVFRFIIGQSGFAAIAPSTFRIGNGTLTGSITNATYIADMAAYTGGLGIITLADFVNDGYGMANALFQTAKALTVTNTDGYVANLQWNDTKEAIELNVTGLPIFFWDNDGTTAGFGTASGTWTSPTTGDGTQGWSKDTTGATLPVSMATTVRSTVNFGNGATGLGAGTINVSGTVTSGNMTFASGSGAITLSGGTLTLAPSATITVNNSSDTISSVLAGAASSLTKAGLGTLILSGANTYTGATLIDAGTLALGANNVLTNVSAVSIGSATLDAGTSSNKAGTLDATGSAVIKLGTGASLAFADSNTIDWTGGTLNLTGSFVSGSSLRFGTTSNGLTVGQLAKISCLGCYNFTLDANGYLKAQRGTMIMFQ